MKNYLKIIDHTFIVVVLVTWFGATTGSAQKTGNIQKGRIDIASKQIVISGSIDNGPLQAGLKIQAINTDIEDITFTPGNLRELTERKIWLTPANIQITPDVKTISAGQSQDFVINIQNIPKSGQYDGIIAVHYKGQAANTQDFISLSVRAVKFDPIPPQLLFKLEKCLICVGLTDDYHLKLSIAEDANGGQLPGEIRTNLSKKTSVTMAPLINNEDKSQVLFATLTAMSQGSDATVKDGVNINKERGVIIDDILKDPKVGAGKYTGSLWVRSEDIGVIATVPVEIQVRYPRWLAWVCLFSGIFISLGLSWWNTVGKKKNNIQGKAYELLNKIEAAQITASCRDQLREELKQVQELLVRNETDNADKALTDIQTNLTACINDKRVLLKMASEVQVMIGALDVLAGRLEQIAQTSDPVLDKYLPDIKTSIEKLKDDISQEKYAIVDDTLKQKVDAEKKRLDDLTSQVIDSLNELVSDVEGLVLDYRNTFGQDADKFKSNLEQTYVQPLKLHLADVKSDKDSVQIAEEIMEDGAELQKANKLLRALTIYDRQIKELKRKGADTSKADEALSICQGLLLAANIPMADESRPDIEDAIKAVFNKFTKSSSSLSRREVKTVERVMRLSVPDIPLRERVRGHVAPITPDTRDAAHRRRQSGLLTNLRNNLTPVRREKVISVSLWLVVVPILAAIGYSQLYENNPTFGSKSPMQEYLTLVLWGFGIQTGTATVSEVVKTIRGT